MALSVTTDAQMQTYCDTRLRVRAEQFRALLIGFRDDRAAIAEVIDRAINGPAWNDARKDGPPNLLTNQDVLTFDAFSAQFVKCFDGVAVSADVAEMKANMPVFQSACVRPV